jgi:hypothetical protein
MLSGNRKALTSTEASTTALFGIGFSFGIDNGQYFCFLLRGGFPPVDDNRP